VFGLQHGFWVAFATLAVMKTSAAGTRISAVQAAIGTAIGFAVATVFIAGIGINEVAYSLALPVLIFLAFFLPGAVSFLVGQIFFTMVVVVLFNLVTPTGWTVGLDRLEDVLVGAGIGLLVGMAIWPRGAAAELARVVADLILKGSRLAHATVDSIVGPTADHPDLDAADLGQLRREASIAATDAEDVFSQFLAEPHPTDVPLIAWSSLMASAHQIWFGASVVATAPFGSNRGSELPELAREVLDAADAVHRTHASLAAVLVDAGPLLITPVEQPEGPVGRRAPTTGLKLRELDAWLRELTVDVEELRPALVELGRPASPGATVEPKGPTLSR
jgi:uncharacterized membrane protein YccC